MSKTMLLLALSIILLNSKSGNHRHHSCEVFREYRVLTTIETFGIITLLSRQSFLLPAPHEYAHWLRHKRPGPFQSIQSDVLC